MDCGKGLLLLVHLTAWYPSPSASDPYKITSKISPGIYPQEVQSPTIFYETFVPLIFEYQVPVYKTLDITLRDWRVKCATDAFAPSYTCPVFYHFEHFMERFEAEVVPQAWVDPPSTINKTQKPSEMRQNLPDFCNKIQPHFQGSITQQYGFEEYLSKLRECPLGESSQVKRAIGDYSENIKSIFKKMSENYEAEFSNKFFSEANKKMGPAFYVNAVTTHQTALLLAYWVEKTRWSQAQLSCNQMKIPEFLLKPGNFSKALRDLNSTFKNGNVEFAVPLEEISLYYKLPLADCSFIESTGNYVVRLMIPVRRKEIKPKMYTLHSVPFIQEGDKGTEICISKEIQGTFVYDEKSGSVQRNSCGSQDFCQLSHQMDITLDLCVRSVLANSSAGIRRHCPFECTPLNETFDTLTLPLVQRISSDTWVITGHTPATVSPNQKLSRRCEGQLAEVALEPQETFGGALEIKLPCDCRLILNSETFYVESPCEAGVDLQPQITSLTSIFLTKEETLEPLNGKGNISLAQEDDLLPESARSSSSAGSANPKGGSEVDPASAKIQSGASKSEVTSTSNTNLGALWALVIFQLIVISILIAVGSYRYYKGRQELAYSKERLVYNIYASPSEPNLSEPPQQNTFNHL